MGKKHPLEEIQNNFVANKEQEKLNRAANLYGSHMAMRLMIEKNEFMKIGRMPGEPRSNLAVDIMTGKINKIEFEDFLGKDRPNTLPPLVHKLICEDRI